MIKREHKGPFNPNLAGAVYSAFNLAKKYWYAQPSEKKMAGYRRRVRRRIDGARTITRRKRRRNGLVKRIRRINRRLFTKGFNSTEVKYRTAALTGNTNSNHGTASTWGHLTNIDGGTNYNQRVGVKVFIRHLNLHIHVKAGTTGTASNEQYVRLVLLRWHDIKDSADWSAVSNIPTLESTELNANAGDRDLALVPFHIISSKWKTGYKVLWNKVIKVSRETGADYEQRLIKKRIRIMKPCSWALSDGDNSVGPGQLVLYAFDNEASAVVSEHPNLKVGYRVSFTDL